MSNRLNKIVMLTDSMENLYNENPILKDGEMCIITNRDDDDNNTKLSYLKVGNGTDNLNNIIGKPLQGYRNAMPCGIFDIIETDTTWCFNSDIEYHNVCMSPYIFTFSELTGTYVNLMSNSSNLPYFAVAINVTLPGYITNIAIADNEVWIGDLDPNPTEMYMSSMKFIPINNSNATEIKEVKFYLCSYEKMLDPDTGRADLYFYIGVTDDGYNTLTELGITNETLNSISQGGTAFIQWWSISGT